MPFDPQKSESIAAVVDSLKENEARNSSLHSFVLVEQAQTEAIEADICRLELEADQIQAGGKAATGAQTDGAAEAETETEALQVMVERTNSVEWKLKHIGPVLGNLLTKYAGEGSDPFLGSTLSLSLRGGEGGGSSLMMRGGEGGIGGIEQRLATADGVIDGMRVLDGAVEALRLRVARLVVARPDSAARRTELEALLRVGESDAGGQTENRYRQLEMFTQNGASAFGADLD
jgi:hypothetical protein